MLFGNTAARHEELLSTQNKASPSFTPDVKDLVHTVKNVKYLMNNLFYID